jgi:hypothetical protein
MHVAPWSQHMLSQCPDYFELFAPFALHCIHTYIHTDMRFEVSAALPMRNAIFWDVTPCGSCKNRHFGGTCQLLFTANVVGSLIIFTVMMEAMFSSKMSVPHDVTS